MAFCSPRDVVQHMKLRKGSRVVDFGAGSGRYTEWLLQAVGDEGRVYALDLNQELLITLKRNATEALWDNLEVLRADLEEKHGSGLGDASIDVVLMANILFQIEDKDAFIEEAKRVLKEGGQLVCVDWKDSFEGTGPAQNYVMTEKTTRDIFGKHGFTFIRELDAGTCHYGLVFQK